MISSSWVTENSNKSKANIVISVKLALLETYILCLNMIFNFRNIKF